MPQHPQRFWLAAFIVAWAVDLLFWDKSIGISYPIFIILALAAGFALAVTEKIRPARLSLVLSGLVVIMALVTIFRAEPFTRLFNGFLTLCSLGLLALTFRSGDWIRFNLMDYFLSGFEMLVIVLSRAAGLPLIPKPVEGSSGRSIFKQGAPVLRGFLLAAPVVLIMGSLLVSADMVFAKQVKDFFELFDLDRMPEYLFRLFYILVLAYAFTGIYLTAVLPKLFLIGKKSQPGAEAPMSATSDQAVEGAAPQPVVKKSALHFLGATESFIVLGSVDLLFAFFVALQFRYFFGGSENIKFDGFTFSEYARRGFFELVAVAALSLLLYLVLNAITYREKVSQKKTFTGLAVFLVAMVGLILLSAWYRLMLYENAYGFTALRTYTHIFIPWLGFLLLATIALQILRREQYFGGLLLLTILGFALSFPVINVDAFIVHKNVERARMNRGMDLDGQYLISLSDDALPALVEEYKQPELNKKVHDVLGGVLACRAYEISKEEKQAAWQSYIPAITLSRLQLSNMDLTAYPIESSEGVIKVTLNGAGKMSCAPFRSQD